MSEFSAADFVGLDTNAISEVMRDWFLGNYEDPVHSLPYESREGGYLWVYGGPYDASEVLHERFGEFVSEAVIQELADELFDECPEWAAQIDLIDDDDLLFDYGLEHTAYFEEYQEAMESHRALLRMGIPEHAENRFYGMIFVNLITALEAYLSDAFTGSVLHSESLLRKFVSSTPEFQRRQISLAEIFDSFDNIRHIAEDHLAGVVWHRLDIVMNMYRDTLGVSFPDDLGAIFRAIHVRHALVHRNGKIQGEVVVITKRNLEDLAEKIEELIENIEEQLGDLAGEEKPSP